MASVEDTADINRSDSTTSRPNAGKCKRVGCENPPIDHPEWDGEYCSAECLSVFCKEAF